MARRRRGGRFSPAANGGKWLWPRTRAAIYLRDGGRCAYCRSGSKHLSIDHYIPPHLGGDNNPRNLVTCCRRCNSRKGRLVPWAWWRLMARSRPARKVAEARKRVRMLRSLDLTPFRMEARHAS